MLSFDQIKEYFTPELARANPKGMIVEYLQHELLDSIFKLPGSEHLSFIGGTAVRILYDSRRFSEDLDFDDFGLDMGYFSRLLEKACREMELKGFDIEYRFVKKGDNFHCHIKFPSILNRYSVPAHYQAKILVSIDAERKKKIFRPDIKVLNKFGIFRKIQADPVPILLSQKLMAILFRRREKGRDFYDASFLSGLAGPDYEYIKKITDIKRDEFKTKIPERCSKLDLPALARDVEPFLFDPDQKERILSFVKTIKGIL
jgi:predicted nucleotidyltransferase component of viral defense system